MMKQHHSDMLNNSIQHDHSDQIDTVNQLFNMITKTCGELNQQEQIKRDYYSLMQTSSVCDFSADLLFLAYCINPSPLQDTVHDHFEQGLKNHVLDKLSCMTDKPLDLYKFMKLCDRINRC